MRRRPINCQNPDCGHAHWSPSGGYSPCGECSCLSFCGHRHPVKVSTNLSVQRFDDNLVLLFVGPLS